MDIKTPEELKQAIEQKLSWDIARYKWYQWYCNTHIKKGTEEDNKNTEIFKELEKTDMSLHQRIEEYIDELLIPKMFQ